MDYKNLPQKFHRKSIRNLRKSLIEPPENAHRESGLRVVQVSGHSLGFNGFRVSMGSWVNELTGNRYWDRQKSHLEDQPSYLHRRHPSEDRASISPLSISPSISRLSLGLISLSLHSLNLTISLSISHLCVRVEQRRRRRIEEEEEEEEERKNNWRGRATARLRGQNLPINP